MGTNILRVDHEDWSFKKAQETMHYVSKDHYLCLHIVVHIYINFLWQELEWQGLGHLSGLCASLNASGSSGKHPQNVKRDVLRKLSKMDSDLQVS